MSGCARSGGPAIRTKINYKIRKDLESAIEMAFSKSFYFGQEKSRLLKQPLDLPVNIHISITYVNVIDEHPHDSGLMLIV